MVAQPSRRRHRGDPRRRLQPHGRRQRARADAVVQGHRQRVATTGCCRTSRATTSTTPAPGTRSTFSIRACCRWSLDSPALLGDTRCMSTASASISRTILAREPHGFDEARRLPRRLPAGSGARRGQADRRAVGHRPRRLSGRALPAGLGGVERPVPRHRARASGGATTGSCRSSPRASPAPATSSTSAAASRGPASTSSPRMTASRSTISSPTTTSTTRRTAKTTATATPTTCRGNYGVEGPTDDPDDHGSCASGRSATCWRRCCSRRARRCCWPATSSAARSRATTTPIARTTRSPGSTGESIDDDGRALARFARKLISCAQALPDPAARPLPDRDATTRSSASRT